MASTAPVNLDRDVSGQTETSLRGDNRHVQSVTAPSDNHAAKRAAYKDVSELNEEDRALFEQYSGFAPEEVLPHLHRIRDRAFDIWPYACISHMRFYSYALAKMPFYSEVLSVLRNGGNFCDAGCCFGQMLRHLAFKDHIAHSQLFGFDLEQTFVEMGYELFRDKDKFNATFTTGNVLDAPSDASVSRLDTFDGRMDVVFCGSFLHFFDWEDMIAAVKRLIRLARPIPGSLICGKQLGSAKPGNYPMRTSKGYNFRHDPATMKQFWEQVGKETNTSWTIESGLYEGLWELFGNTNLSWSEPNQRMIWWKAVRS